jgi:diguanylate cyclase (GGDEF)-like protein/PAS domain S-box-containing protein
MIIQPTLPSRRRRYLGEWLFLLAGLLISGVFIAYSLYEDRTETDSNERERLTSQAALIETNLAPQMLSTRKALDSILASLPAWHLEQGSARLANQQLQLLVDTLSGIGALLIINAEGQVLASNEEKLIGQNLSHRDYFQAALKNGDTQTLYLTPPFKTVLDTFVMSFYRVIPSPTGKFGGIVIASVDPKYFSTLLDSVRYTSDARSFLIHGDGKLFMVAPERLDLNGKDLAVPNSLFTRHRNSGQAVSVFAETTYVSNEERLSAFRTIQPADLSIDKPLVVVVSRELQAVFADWKRESLIEGSMFGAFALISILGLFFHQRRQKVFDRFADAQHQALRTSEARLQSFFDSSPDALLISDEQGMITMSNLQGERILGYAADELVGQSIEILLPDRSRENHPGLRAMFAASPVVRRMGQGLSVSARRKDGSEVDVEISLGRIETGQGSYFACGLRDITASRKAQEALRESESRYRSALSALSEGVTIQGGKGEILDANHSATSILGLSLDQLKGRTSIDPQWQAVHDDGSPWPGETHPAMVTLETGKAISNAIMGIHRPDGSLSWISINSAPILAPDEELPHAVVTSFIDITHAKKAEVKINELAFFDQLTGLPNRTLLLDRLKQAMTIGSRSGSFGALLFIDLDNFKELNDTLGHEVGDLLLKQVAERLTQCVREGDTVARLGGDEFVVILSNLGNDERDAATGTETAAEKILATLNQIYRFGGSAHHSTASIGATLFNGHPISIDTLMKQADLSMYKAKEAGRSTLRFFDPAMEVAVKARVALENDLRQAVEGKHFVLYYQAQVAGGQVTGAEVLLRWQHAERGMVSPAEFIPLAEETGLILPLGLWVLETACTQLAVWAALPAMAHFTLAVNVSALQFKQPDFVNQVLTVLKNTGANPCRLKLEITESMLVDNVQDIIEKMFALKAKGVRFSLDDFGTGYSSLSYLKRMPLDQLKIDQTFVRDIMVDANDAVIARTIVALAQSLGLGVIAEGVETEAQKDFLASSGCHAYQGNFFSRPLPLADFEKYEWAAPKFVLTTLPSGSEPAAGTRSRLIKRVHNESANCI